MNLVSSVLCLGLVVLTPRGNTLGINSRNSSVYNEEPSVGINFDGCINIDDKITSEFNFIKSESLDFLDCSVKFKPVTIQKDEFYIEPSIEVNDFLYTLKQSNVYNQTSINLSIDSGIKWNSFQFRNEFSVGYLLQHEAQVKGQLYSGDNTKLGFGYDVNYSIWGFKIGIWGKISSYQTVCGSFRFSPNLIDNEVRCYIQSPEFYHISAELSYYHDCSHAEVCWYEPTPQFNRNIDYVKVSIQYHF